MTRARMLRCCVMTSRSPVRRVSTMGNAAEPENTSGGAEGAAGVVAGVELLPQAPVRQDTTSSTRNRDLMGDSSEGLSGQDSAQPASVARYLEILASTRLRITFGF